MGLLTLACAVCIAMILPIAETNGYSACFPYSNGQFWVTGPNTICECKDGRRVCAGDLGHCIGRGDVHYRSIDGKRFDFQGLCRYVLTSNCCMRYKFVIEIEQVRWKTTTAAVSDSFTIRFSRYRIILEKPNVLKVFWGTTQIGGSPFFNDANLRCEKLGGYMYVILKRLRVYFRWNFVYSLDVWMSRQRYRNKLCGLCGDFNGNPANDLRLTPYGERVTNINQWGESWRVARHNQPGRCRCASDTPPTPPDCTAHTAKMDECDTLMTGGVFAACNADLAPAPYITDCRVEMCECAIANIDGCLCVGASGYIQACKLIGHDIDMTWTVDAKCPVCKDPDTGVIYQNGTMWYYQCKQRVCNAGTIDETVDSNCCIHDGFYYMEGQTRIGLCNKYTCRGGEWVFDSRICCYHNGQSYQFNEEWRVNQCSVCTCDDKGEVSCTWDPIKCPAGFELTESCCCLPPEWVNPAKR